MIGKSFQQKTYDLAYKTLECLDIPCKIAPKKTISQNPPFEIGGQLESNTIADKIYHYVGIYFLRNEYWAFLPCLNIMKNAQQY